MFCVVPKQTGESLVVARFEPNPVVMANPEKSEKTDLVPKTEASKELSNTDIADRVRDKLRSGIKFLKLESVITSGFPGLRDGWRTFEEPVTIKSVCYMAPGMMHSRVYEGDKLIMAISLVGGMDGDVSEYRSADNGKFYYYKSDTSFGPYSFHGSSELDCSLSTLTLSWLGEPSANVPAYKSSTDMVEVFLEKITGGVRNPVEERRAALRGHGCYVFDVSFIRAGGDAVSQYLYINTDTFLPERWDTTISGDGDRTRIYNITVFPEVPPFFKWPLDPINPGASPQKTLNDWCDEVGYGLMGWFW